MSLRQEGRIDFPDIPIAEKNGSWSLFWNADQHLWQDPCDPSRGWGLFGRAGISDGNPNPIEWSVSFGVGALVHRFLYPCRVAALAVDSTQCGYKT